MSTPIYDNLSAALDWDTQVLLDLSYIEKTVLAEASGID